MLTQIAIQEAVTRIVSVAQSPLKVIVFGSYATGRAHDSSDLDLLVVEDEIDSMPAEYGKIRSALGTMGVGVDLLLYPKQEFDKRVNWQSSPVFDAVRQGQVLYERPH
jgi:predicted nucleotidyltransferase